jgi:hypothetical protein
LVRERAAISVSGVREEWRLEWKSPPVPECGAEGAVWVTCPCNGFAFGERGLIDLVRLRTGQEYDRLALSPLFSHNDLNVGPQAVLQRWPVAREDIPKSESDELAASVRMRPVVKIVDLADYNHDGQSTEFFLQTGTLPCGKRTGVVVGVSQRNGRLHAFGTVLNPYEPLVLQYNEWQALRKASKPVRVTDWHCGDHGANTETEVELSATADGIEATWREFGCTNTGERGRFLKERRR